MTESEMRAVGDPVLQAITKAAVDAIGAVQGWILAPRDKRLMICAASGLAAETLVGADIPAGSGSSGYVMSSGQPLALSSSSDDDRLSEGVAALTGRRPSSVLAVPCSDGESVLGVLELFDKVAGGPFSFDDVEIVALLADVGAAAIATTRGRAQETPRPEVLSEELKQLAVTDPSRYATVATLISSLLAGE